MKPIARKDRLIKQVVDQDTLVYNSANDTACCLNPLASAVWRHCDGTRTVEQIAMLVAREIPLPEGADPVAVTWRVVDELEEHNLLATAAGEVLNAAAAKVGRRDLVKTFVAVGLFPSIQQITAPLKNQVASPPPPVTPSNSLSASATPTLTPTASSSASVTPTPTPSLSTSLTPTPTPTPSRSL